MPQTLNAAPARPDYSHRPIGEGFMRALFHAPTSRAASILAATDDFTPAAFQAALIHFAAKGEAPTGRALEAWRETPEGREALALRAHV